MQDIPQHVQELTSFKVALDFYLNVAALDGGSAVKGNAYVVARQIFDLKGY